MKTRNAVALPDNAAARARPAPDEKSQSKSQILEANRVKVNRENKAPTKSINPMAFTATSLKSIHPMASSISAALPVKKLAMYPNTRAARNAPSKNAI